MNEQDNSTIALEEDDVLLPDGYEEGDDIFDQSTWTGDGQADEPGETGPDQESGEGAESSADEAPTTEPQEEQGVPAESAEEAPTTEPAEGDEAKKLKFKARVDRTDLDVEVDESELPTLYQKAQVVDRVQAKLAKLTPQVEKAERLAKSMGFETMDEMLAAAEGNYRDAEVARLVSEGVHEEVAKDMVTRRMGAAASAKADVPPAAAPQSETQAAAPETRDFKAEVRALLEARPDLVGKEIPSEVVSDCVKNRKPLLAAYARYEREQARAENERLSKRIKVLEQNAATAARSPVKGVTGGGPTDTKPKDPFLEGFDSDY